MKSVHIDQGKTYYKMVSDEGVAVLDIVFDFEEKCWLISSKEPTTAFQHKAYMGVHQKEEVVSLAIKMLRRSAEFTKIRRQMRSVLLVYVVILFLLCVTAYFHRPFYEFSKIFMPFLIAIGLVGTFCLVFRVSDWKR